MRSVTRLEGKNCVMLPLPNTNGIEASTLIGTVKFNEGY
jgi:hypothetical protein